MANHKLNYAHNYKQLAVDIFYSGNVSIFNKAGQVILNFYFMEYVILCIL